MSRILVTGALGPIGAELVPALRKRSGADQVVAPEIRFPREPSGGPFAHCDCTA
jgi:nucleoside-diphosphate-sugar epimerase